MQKCRNGRRGRTRRALPCMEGRRTRLGGGAASAARGSRAGCLRIAIGIGRQFSFPVRVHGRGACESDDGGRLCASAAAASEDVVHGGGEHAGTSAAGAAARVLAASQHRAAAGARRLPQGLPRTGQYTHNTQIYAKSYSPQKCNHVNGKKIYFNPKNSTFCQNLKFFQCEFDQQFIKNLKFLIKCRTVIRTR
jgi:hypothetical protein